jgi:hypothetical protein
MEEKNMLYNNRKPSFRKGKKFDDIESPKQHENRFYACYLDLKNKGLTKIKIKNGNWWSEVYNLRNEVVKLNLENEYWYIF